MTWMLLSAFFAGVIVGFVAGAVPFGLLLLRSDENAAEAIRLLRTRSRKEPEEGRREEYWN